MIKKISILSSFLCFFVNAHVDRDPGEGLYPQIQKIDNGLYFAKIPEKPLYLVMERVTDKNLRNWQEYARIQNNPRSIDFAKSALRSRGSNQTFTNDGTGHFELVLRGGLVDRNEVWVAYVTSNNSPQHIPGINVQSRIDYLSEFMSQNKGNAKAVEKMLERKFEENIKMFVTITSSPHALITSHIGVSASIDGIIVGDTKGLSIDLHSFGAQVMKRRNPRRRYMINAPVTVMAKIIEKALPKGSVFVGTRDQEERYTPIRKEIAEWEETHGKVPRPSFEDFVKAHPELQREISERAKQLAKKTLQTRIEDTNKAIRRVAEEEKMSLEEAQKEHMETTEIEYFRGEKGRKYRNWYYQDRLQRNSVSGELEFEKDFYESLLEEKKHDHETDLLTKSFNEAHPLKPMEDMMPTIWFPLMQGNPSILSVTGNYLTIYESPTSQKSWLHIEEGNPNYDWVFSEPFWRAGNTWYIAVDIDALAKARPVEAIQ